MTSISTDRWGAAQAEDNRSSKQAAKNAIFEVPRAFWDLKCKQFNDLNYF